MLEEKAIKRLNAFKNFKIMYGDKLGITIDKVSLLQEDIEIVLNMLKTKDKIIDTMAEELVEAHEWFYSEFDNFTKEDFIKYFTNKVK